MTLKFSTQITEKRDFGRKTVNQEIVISVQYDTHDDSIECPEVWIYENGVKLCEISKLLDKAEGQPLIAMLDAIDWRGVYEAQIEQVEEIEQH